ncbi:uncharacterized protein LOC107003667 [Solanum pennellii]|uniref:Uncharacterized protein LOC107003667 n=1 Tax=Solanum pennellii TaxID=28526 RepID=A0ABM1FIV4_SOLPN|nr:uncharacterized protein LOC107003667 [Solanum pennellii]
MVVYMMSMISFFIVGLSHQSSKEGKTTMLIRDMDIARLIIHVQEVEEDELKDKEGFTNKRTKTLGNDFMHQKSSTKWSSFKQKHKGPSLPSTTTLIPKTKNIYCEKGFIGCFKRGHSNHFLRECPDNKQGSGNQSNKVQSSSGSPPDRASPRGENSDTSGGTNH